MAQQPTMKFNSNSKGFSLGWDAPDVRPAASKSFFSSRIQPVETMSSTRGTKFLEKKANDVCSKVGTSDLKLLTPESTPKITRNDKERSTFYFGDHPPTTNERAFLKKDRTEKEIEEERVKYDTNKHLKQKAKKEETEKLQNQSILKIQQNSKKRQSFRF